MSIIAYHRLKAALGTVAISPSPAPKAPDTQVFPTFLLPSFSLPFRRRASGISPNWPTSNPNPTAGAEDESSGVPSLSSSPTSTLSDSDPASPVYLDSLSDWAAEFDAPTSQPPPPRTIHKPQPDTIRCLNCSSDLAFGAQIVSKGFTGSHGRAFLVSPPSSLSCTPPGVGLDRRQPYGLSEKELGEQQFNGSELLNIKVGRSESRALVTGAHVVADITCAVCGTKVGWKYVHATEPSQRYKEGRFILETARTVVYKSLEDVDESYGVDGWDDGGGAAAASRRSSYVRGSLDSEESMRDDEDEESAKEIVFDSNDEEECEDIFAGTWDPAVVSKRRQKKVAKLKGRK